MGKRRQEESQVSDDAIVNPGCSSRTFHKQEDIVLCKIYRKATSLKELEQRAAMEAGMRVFQQDECYPSKNTISFSYEENYNKVTTMVIEEDEEKEMNYELLNKDVEESSLTSSLQSMSHEELRLQRNGSLEDTLEWLHDPFFTQLHSPLIDQCWSPYSNAFNF
ncbi:hypothetical protein J5N97_029099 [Dioscorea zingiberensis]|uniref:Uncharacterized protein n=1 Tax=Dioscorea zingiberensis TaxID=325984 RepID=A0A9D5H5K8_9LILI|nr:hypothetical protein J5N97_029099 [Dioscorea zingiberensis]